MGTPKINIPEGYELENPSIDKIAPKIPEGFELENKPSSYLMNVARDIVPRKLENSVLCD